MFGGTHAPCCVSATDTADEFMETLPIQLAGTAAPTGSASPILGMPTAGESFASKLDRALADASEAGEDGASFNLKAPSRAKSAPEVSSDSTAMLLLTCLVTSFVQPPSHVPLSTGSTESIINKQTATTESSSGSLTDSPSSLNGSTDEAGANAARLPLPPSLGAGVAAVTLAAGAGQIAGLTQPARAGSDTLPTVTAKSGSGEPSEGRLATREHNDKSAPPGQNPLADAVSAASASTSVSLPRVQDTVVSIPSAGPTVGEGQTEPKSLHSSAPPLAQDAQPWRDSQAASSMNHSGTPLETSGLAPVPAAPTLPSREDLPAPSGSMPSSGLAEQAATPVSQTGAPSSPTIANSHNELAEFSAALGNFSTMEVTVKVPKSGTAGGAALNHKVTAESQPLAIGAPQNGGGKIAYQPFPSSFASKAENPVNNASKATLGLPSSDAKELSGRNAVQAETNAGDVKEPLVTPTAASSDQFALNSPTPNPVITPRNDTASGGSDIQRSLVTPASSAASDAQSSTFDSSTSGQGKSGRQNAPGPGDGSATFVQSMANSPGPDPAASPLTAHTPSVPAIHANTSTPPTPPPSSSAQQATTLSAWQNYDGGAGKIVRSASLTESAGGGEMHVELRSGPMGPIEVHTVVRDGSVGAEIHVQGQEAHTLLSAGLPSLERALTDRNLRVENIAVYQDHAGGGMSGGGRQDSPSDSSPSPHHQALPWDGPPQPGSSARSQLAGEESENPAAGLSVQA